jgi:hypothetical protein
MKITVINNLDPVMVLRRAGYGQVMDRRATEVSYNRRLGSGFYPRFHAYVNGNVINFHLDQKQASYEGSSAHSGEYDGDTVEAEGERIIESMERLAGENQNEENALEPKEKTGFWGRMFS